MDQGLKQLLILSFLILIFYYYFFTGVDVVDKEITCPAIVIVAPAIAVFYVVLTVFTDGGQKRLRFFINKKAIKQVFLDKIQDGITRHKIWKNR